MPTIVRMSIITGNGGIIYNTTASNFIKLHTSLTTAIPLIKDNMFIEIVTGEIITRHLWGEPER